MRVAELQQLLTWQATLRNQLRVPVPHRGSAEQVRGADRHRPRLVKRLRSQITGESPSSTRSRRGRRTPRPSSRRDKSNMDADQGTQAAGHAVGRQPDEDRICRHPREGVRGDRLAGPDGQQPRRQPHRDRRRVRSAARWRREPARASVHRPAQRVSPATTPATSAAAAAGDATSAAGDTTAADRPRPDPTLLQRLLDQAHLATSVAEQQLSVCRPPRRSAAASRPAASSPARRACRGRSSRTAARPSPRRPPVHVHFANGMDWLKQFVSVEVNQNTRGQARNASRILAGSRYR